MKDCKYLRYVNDESLRLYPVVPINARYANKDTTLPRGGGKDGSSPIFIPKGSSCDFSVHVMHRRKDIWGPDADEFKPERWDGRKVGWEYLPVSYIVATQSLTTTHTSPMLFFFYLCFTHPLVWFTKSMTVQWGPEDLHRPAICAD